MIVQGHAGHWLLDLAYFLPVAGFMVWLGWTTVRDRRRGRREEERGARDSEPET